MAQDPEFGKVARQALRHLSQKEIAERTDISQAYVSQILGGKVPSREKLVHILDTCEVRGWERARLFELADYLDPRERISAEVKHARVDPFPEYVRDLAVEMADLSPEQVDLLRRVVRKPRLFDALDAFLDPNSPTGPYAPGALCAAAR